MSALESIALALAALCVLSAVGLIHLQNQVNRLRRSQRSLADAVSISVASMIEYIDAIQKENR